MQFGFYWQFIIGMCFSDAVTVKCVATLYLSVYIRVDGGVASNDFVMQMTADLFGRKVARPQHHEMSCLGAACVAGLGAGMQTHIHTQHVCWAVGMF